jgi:excinuclease ABC subunit B
LLRRLVDSLYSRSETEFRRGNFRVKGDTVDVFLAYGDIAYRIIFWGDEIEEISGLDPQSGTGLQKVLTRWLSTRQIYLSLPGTECIRLSGRFRMTCSYRSAFFNDRGMKQEAHRLQQKWNMTLK